MEEREISLKDLFLVIWKGKYIIALSALVLFIVAMVGAFIYDSGKSELATVVSLEWSGVSEGEYPDGSRFDYGSAIEPYVISLAIEELGYDVTSTDVRDATSLTPIVPEKVLQLILTALENGENITYFPSNYKIILDNGSLDLSVEEGSNLIYEIIEQFRLDFERKFVNQVTVIDLTNSDFAAYDYLDAYDILVAQKTAIDASMNLRKDTGFYSPSLGLTFTDVLAQTSLVGRIELSQIDTRTNTYLLTKDKEYLITNYEYKIQLAQLELNKVTAKEVSAQDLVDNYAGSVNTILIPGLETAGIDVETYYNVLMSNLVELQNSNADLAKDIEYYQLQINRLEDNDPGFNVTAQQQIDEAVKVDGFIVDADQKLESIVLQANTILAEYNDYVTSNTIKPLMAPQEQDGTSKLILSAVGLVIGAGLGTVYVLFKHDWE